MISDEVWDKVREAWFATIPEQYRYTGKEHNGSNHAIGAIILPPPPKPLLDSWFGNIKQHLTAAQLKAKANRENWCKPGVRKGEPWTPRRRSGAASSRARWCAAGAASCRPR